MSSEPPSRTDPSDADSLTFPQPSEEVRERLAEETRTANAIYGIIVGSAVMASVHGETVGRLTAAVLVTLLIYWTAERYAHVMARQIVHPSRLRLADLRRELGHGWELVTASFVPLGVLLGTRALGATVSTAVLAALLCSTVLLLAAGWQVGREAGLHPLARLLSAAFAGAFGVSMVLLKTLLH